MKRDAIISECGTFRYWLRRQWDSALPTLAFIMLNPSTADADIDDPTIRKCIGFARRLGFGGIVVVNLFAFRATQPADLKRAGYPAGPENNQYIAMAAGAANQGGRVVCAWGVNARKLSRPAEVLESLHRYGVTPHALKLTDDGVPWHPLMLPYSCELQPMRVAA